MHMAVAGRAASNSGCSGIPAKSISGNCRGGRFNTPWGHTCVVRDHQSRAAISKGMFEFLKKKKKIFSV